MIIRKILFLFAFIILLNCSYTLAQTVSTYLTGSGLNGPDGFALDKTGTLYVANWGGGTGKNRSKNNRQHFGFSF